MLRFFIYNFLLVLCGSCSLRGIIVTENVTYMEDGYLGELPEKRLNIFQPKKIKEPLPVLVFIHGGSWRSGSKEKYSLIARRWARRNIVAVIIDYPLSPEYKIHSMAKASAKAVNWVEENIADYGGDPKKIVLSGHSAGGHLASLISIREEYFDSLGVESPIAAAVLNDAAGLDMYHYLKEENNAPGTSHLKTFTDSPEVWKDTSPIYFLHEEMPPMLFMMGGKTYESIIIGTERFMKEYKKFVPEPKFKIQKNKRHIPMMLQMVYTPSKGFKWVIDFVRAVGEND